MGKRKAAPRAEEEAGGDSTYAQCLADLSHVEPRQRHGACSLLGNIFLANSSHSAAAVVTRFTTADMLARLHTRLQDSDRNVALEAARAVRNALLSECATERLREYGFLSTVCALLRSRLVGMLADPQGYDFMDAMLCEQLLLCVINLLTHSEEGVDVIISNKMCAPLVNGLLGFSHDALLATRMLCADALFTATDGSPAMCVELSKQPDLVLRLTQLAQQQHSSSPGALIGLRAAGVLLHLSSLPAGAQASGVRPALVDGIAAAADRAQAALALDSGDDGAEGGVSCEYYSKLSHWYHLDTLKLSGELLSNLCLEGRAGERQLPHRLLLLLAASLESVASFLQRNEPSLKYEALTASQGCAASLCTAVASVAGLLDEPRLLPLCPRVLASAAQLLQVLEEDAAPLKMALLGALLVLAEQAGGLAAPEQLLQRLCMVVSRDEPAVAALAAEALAALAAGSLLAACSEALLARVEALVSGRSMGGAKARLLAAAAEAYVDLHSGDGDEALELYRSAGAGALLARAAAALPAQHSDTADTLQEFLSYKQAFIDAAEPRKEEEATAGRRSRETKRS